MTCLTEPQVKFLIEKYFEVQELKRLDSICEIQRQYGDSIIRGDNSIQKNQTLLISNKNNEIQALQENAERLTEELNAQIKKTKVQKTYKWVSIVSGSFCTAFVGYKFITK